MDLPIRQSRTNGKWFASRALKAIERYGLIEAQDKVAVALSGGKDSISLLAILDYLRRYSHLDFQLMAVHVRMGEYDTSSLEGMCKSLGVPYREVPLKIREGQKQKGKCSICARLKRGAIKRAALAEGFNKVALGHHADDVAQTVFMNLAKRGEFICFCPFLALKGDMAIIRPLVYLREETLMQIQKRFRLPVLDFSCPFGGGKSRIRAKAAIEAVAREIGVRDLPLRVIGALEKLGVWRERIQEDGRRR